MENMEENQVEKWNDLENMEERLAEKWKDFENTEKCKLNSEKIR